MLIEVNTAHGPLCYTERGGGLARAAILPETGEAMAYYRLYFMDPRSGHIAAFEEIEADGDDRAIAAAERHRGAQPLELWCGGKKVHRIEVDLFNRPRDVAEAAGQLH